MYAKKLVYVIVALFAAALLWGCGSSGSGGSAVTPRTGPDVLESEASCFGCHAEGAMYYAHNPANPIWGMGTDAEDLVGTVSNLYDIQHSCQDCHGGGAAHSGTRGSLPHPRPTIAVCAECHVNEAVASDYHTFVNNFGANILACTTCHAPLELETLVSAASPVLNGENVRIEYSCADCHNSDLTVPQLAVSPYSDEIQTRFNTSRHANQRARAAYCSSCHSHEGGVTLLNMPRMTSNEQLAAVYNDTLDVYLLPAATSTIEGVTRKNCATCHNPHDATLRGDGDVIATAGNVSGFPAQSAPAAIDGEIRVAYSAEFNLCAACHMVDLNATWDAEAGYNNRGMIRYELSDAYTATMLDANGVTYDRSGVFYHDGASGNGRTMIDTHFAGTVHSVYVNFDASIAPVEVVGYNINPGDPNACTICHDPHTGGKMLSVEAGQADNINNMAIGYAEGLGEFHTDYLGDAFSRNQTGCQPCHTGNSFVKQTFGATPAAERWNVVGCRSCHDLAVPNSTPNTNDAAAFAAVREFPAGYTFAFPAWVDGAVDADAGAPVAVADLGANQICFECHKGRTPGLTPAQFIELDNTFTVGTTTYPGTRGYDISYLHYAPSFAVLYGAESQMVATYPGKTYAGRFTHPGGAEFGCVDCHDVHNTNGNNATESRMTNPDFGCIGCHGIGESSDAVDLKARTEAFSTALLDAIYDAMLVAATAVNGLPDPVFNYAAPSGGGNLYNALIAIENAATEDAAKQLLIEHIELRVGVFPSKDIARAAQAWKVFTYEDGSPHGPDGVHGHGGSWAHNSAFARQVMYDAIEALGGDVTGLTRP